MQNNPHTQHQTWPRPLTWLLAFLSLSILALQCASPIHSNDLWWHMALGRHILETGKLIVDQSIFTWTYATPYIIYNAWLSEVTLYLIYAKFGVIGLIALRYLVYCGFFALAVFFALQRGIAANPLTWIVITLGIVLAFLARLVQPELFSFAFMCITVWLYFSIRALGVAAWQRCYWFPVIVVLWINSHGGFVMSAFFFVAMAIGELLNVKFSPNLALPSKLRTHLFIALALCVPALLLNPFGYALPLYLLQRTTTFSELTNLSGIISGWEPTFGYNAPPYYALDYLLAAMAIYSFLIWQQIKRQRTDWVVILAFIAYSAFYINMVRTTHFLAPVFVFASLDLLAYKEHSWAWPLANKAKMAIAACSLVFIAMIGWRTTQGVVCSDFGSLWASSGIDSKYPTEEVEYVRHLPGVKKLGNTYNTGGYVMYRLWPTILHMIDQRYNPFTSWFEQYIRFASTAATSKTIKSFMDTHKADVWLIDHENIVLIDWFATSKLWVPSFFGPAGVVFSPASGASMPCKISPNIEHTDSTIALLNSFHTALELREWAVAERIHKQVASIAARCPFCASFTDMANDMQVALPAARAFYYGDYETTAQTLKQRIPFDYLNSLALLSNRILAQRAWVSNDYPKARILAIDTLKMAPKDAISVYNAAIADWQYRRSEAANKLPVKDDINWQFLVNILLTHKEQIPKNHIAVISVMSAMQKNTLIAKPQFIIQ